MILYQCERTSSNPFPSRLPQPERLPHPSLFWQLSTSGFLYVPATYTLLDYLLARPAELIEGRRVLELGAGLGLCASVLQQWHPPAARLLATDGDCRVIPLLGGNLCANAGLDGAGHQVLRWGADRVRSSGLAAAWDVVVAADAVFHAHRPDERRDTGRAPSHATTTMISDLLETAAALLDTGGHLVLSVEPRDHLGDGLLTASLFAVAAASGLRCVEARPRRLDGQLRPEWQTDVYVFQPGVHVACPRALTT